MRLVIIKVCKGGAVMLLQFNCENFRSFKNSISLDMRASGSNELSYHLRKAGNERVLPITAIYGANASGKSNILAAFELMCFYVSDSIYFEKEDKRNPFISNERDPFKFTVDSSLPSLFEVFYIDKINTQEKYYNYGFTVDDKGIDREWLRVNTKTKVSRNKPYQDIFYRKRGDAIKFFNSLPDSINEDVQKNLLISLNDHLLLVSLGALLNVTILKRVSEWFKKCHTVDYNSRALLNILQTGLKLDSMRVKYLPDEKSKNEKLRFLQSFDPSILDLQYEKLENYEPESNGYRVFSIHQSIDSNDKIKLPFEEESDGTVKLYNMYDTFQKILIDGGTLIADELDTKLHPLLMRNIVLMFTDPDVNTNNAQLVFTTHNTIYMDMNILRRDEIWFTEKHNNISDLFSLDDIVDAKGNKVRKDSNLAKNYLLGNYGAIPYLSNQQVTSDE